MENSVARGELSAPLGRNVMLCLDELLTNIIKCAEREKGVVTVELVVREQSEKLTVLIKDDGPIFNPFGEVKDPDIEADLDQRTVGGLVVYILLSNLVRRIVTHIKDDKILSN